MCRFTGESLTIGGVGGALPVPKDHISAVTGADGDVCDEIIKFKSCVARLRCPLLFASKGSLIMMMMGGGSG